MPKTSKAIATHISQRLRKRCPFHSINSVQPHERVLPVMRDAARALCLCPQSHWQSHILCWCLLVPTGLSATNLPKRQPVMSLKGRAAATSILRHPQEVTWAPFRLLADTSLILPHAQRHTQRARRLLPVPYPAKRRTVNLLKTRPVRSSVCSPSVIVPSSFPQAGALLYLAFVCCGEAAGVSSATRPWR